MKCNNPNCSRCYPERNRDPYENLYEKSDRGYSDKPYDSMSYDTPYAEDSNNNEDIGYDQGYEEDDQDLGQEYDQDYGKEDGRAYILEGDENNLKGDGKEYNKKNDEDYENPQGKYDGQWGRKKPNTQTHVHEFAGSTTLAGKPLHNHRFAGVTGEVIACGDSHVHPILVNTDFFFNHYHEVGLRTGPAIMIDGGRHIHYVQGRTTINFGHDHDFFFTTFIENPIQG